MPGTRQRRHVLVPRYRAPMLPMRTRTLSPHTCDNYSEPRRCIPHGRAFT